jgi:hypothetical protein
MGNKAEVILNPCSCPKHTHTHTTTIKSERKTDKTIWNSCLLLDQMTENTMTFELPASGGKKATKSSRAFKTNLPQAA